MSHQRYAYLIGANGPKQMSLHYAETDVTRLAETLMGPYSQFTEAKAVIADNRDKGLAALQKIARQCDPSDTLLVHFSGHAIFDGHLYLLCNNTDCDNLFVTAIDIRTIKDILGKCRSQSKPQFLIVAMRKVHMTMHSKARKKYTTLLGERVKEKH